MRSSIKTAARKFRDAVTAGDAAVISTELRTASKALDIAVSKGVLHRNTAANKKSSMAISPVNEVPLVAAKRIFVVVREPLLKVYLRFTQGSVSAV